jgi:hypothetical protein
MFVDGLLGKVPVEDENTVRIADSRRTRGSVALAQWTYVRCTFQYLEEKSFPPALKFSVEIAGPELGGLG